MTIAEAAESGTVEDTAAAPEAAVSSQDDARDWEAEAREVGWIPEAEFKGTRKPEKFKSAQEFVEGIPPYVKKLLEKTEAKFNDKISKIEGVNKKTLAAVQRDAEEKIAALKAERREAIKAGDADKVDALEEKIDALKDDAPTDKKLTGAALEKHQAKVQADWVKENTWYETDDDMFEYALGFSNRLLRKTPDITIEENLAQVDAAMRKKFPEKFGGAAKGANGHAPVDGGGAFNGAGGGRKDPLTGLSAVEKAKAKDDMAKFPKVYPDAESWLKAYNS